MYFPPSVGCLQLWVVEIWAFLTPHTTSRGNTFPMFMYSRFSAFLSPLGRENKLRGSRHTKRKAQRNENNKKNENWTWQVKGGKGSSDQITHHILSPAPTLKHANPKNRYSVGRRENWIFRLSKPHQTRQRSFSVALFQPNVEELALCAFLRIPSKQIRVWVARRW